MTYSSLSAPAFHLHELVTFTCNTTGFEQIATLRLYYQDKNKVYKVGCAKVFGIWESINELIHASNGIDGADIDAAYCNSISRETGFSPNVELSITDKSVTGLFTCKAHRVSFGEALSVGVEVKKIKGDLT